MMTGELKSKVDRIWDTIWSGGISNPLSVIEQLTYLLFIKRLDELQTLREPKAARTGKPIEEPVFTPEQDHLRWSRFKETAPEQMFDTLRDEVFPFIKSLGQSGGDKAEEDSTYSHHMKDALFMMPKRVLANVVDQLDSIDMANSDTKGDLYEYMLGKIASAGQNGQFRTPRHIIKLMVDMTAPAPKDVISAGRAGCPNLPSRGWCPYCNIELRALQAALPEISAHEATLVAVSPETPDQSLSTAEKNSLEFSVLSDLGNRVAREYGLVFTLPESLRPVYADFGIDIPTRNGDDSFDLPVPATYVIDQNGNVRFAFVNADYRQRAEPSDILSSLSKLDR